MLPWLLALAPEVSRRPPPAPVGGGPLFGLLGVLIIVVWLVWFLFRRKRTDAGPRKSIGGGVGNALFDLGSIVDPTRPDAAVIMKLEEEEHQDEAGDGRKPPEPRPLVNPPRHRGVGSGPQGDEAFKPQAPPGDDAR